MKKIVTAAVIAAVVGAFSIAAVAGPEAGHPNLIAAREDIHHAQDKIRQAQAANHEDMGGHAARALELLGQAEEEIRLAAEAANRH